MPTNLVLEKDLFEKFLNLGYNKRTKKDYLWALKEFDGVEATLDAVQEVVSGWKGSPQGTVSVKRAAIRALLKYLERNGKIDSFSHLLIFPKGEPRKKRRPLTDDEAHRLWMASEGDLEGRAILSVLISTGMRLGTVPRIKVKHIGMEVFSLLSKGGNEVKFYPNDFMRRHLVRYAESEGLGQEDYIFRNLDGGPAAYNHMWKVFKRMRVEAGLQEIDVRVVSHQYRHTFATALSRAGASQNDIQELLGHKSPISTAGYITANEDGLRALTKEIGNEVYH